MAAGAFLATSAAAERSSRDAYPGAGVGVPLPSFDHKPFQIQKASTWFSACRSASDRWTTSLAAQGGRGLPTDKHLAGGMLAGRPRV